MPKIRIQLGFLVILIATDVKLPPENNSVIGPIIGLEILATHKYLISPVHR